MKSFIFSKYHIVLFGVDVFVHSNCNENKLDKLINHLTEHLYPGQKAFWWFRIFGYGLLFSNMKICEASFSERNHVDIYFQYKHWRIKLLK